MPNEMNTSNKSCESYQHRVAFLMTSYFVVLLCPFWSIAAPLLKTMQQLCTRRFNLTKKYIVFGNVPYMQSSHRDADSFNLVIQLYPIVTF